MPRFEPFAGLRYQPSSWGSDVSRLDEVIAPPYDVIDQEERDRLAARSLYNSVRVELPEDDQQQRLDRYQVASHLMTAWRQSGVLAQESQPCFYGYRMSFTDGDGIDRQTTGVIGGLEVGVPGEGDVLPHERTMPKPKGDRLYLIRACRANLSPVWGLSLSQGLTSAIDLDAAPDATAADDEGVIHELWLIQDPADVATISKLISSEPVVIADGHHRFETALAYAKERREAKHGQPGDYDLVMTFMVELIEDQLTVRPIHRLITEVGAQVDLPKLLGEHFDMEPWHGRVGGELIRAMDEKGGPALLTRNGAFLLRAKPRTVSSAGDDLDSSHLEHALTSLPSHELRYEPSWSRVASEVQAGPAQAGVLLRPATVAQIARWARSRRKMPPKTTFFQPKPRTGMVFRPVVD